MELKQIYSELLDTAGKLGIKIRRESGNFRSGYCIINDEEVLLLNKSQPIETISAIIARTIVERETDGIFLKPVIRDFIEKERIEKVAI
jgi:hypothetical protein